MNELTIISDVPAVQETASQRLLRAFLSGRTRRTHEAYRADLRDFAAFVGMPLDNTMDYLIGCTGGEANELALAFRTHMTEAKLSPATVNRKLAALRSAMKVAKLLGIVAWTIEVDSLRVEGIRDTRGPGVDGFKAILGATGDDAKGLRNRAALRLLFDLGLRRSEVCGIDLSDYDGESVMILGKGKLEKERLTLPAPTRAAIEAWLTVRGREPGSLFRNMHGGPLCDNGLWLVVKELGEKVGLKVAPHKLRHAAITQVLELTNGNVRHAQLFSRHSDVRVVQRYDDCRQDVAGKLASKLAECVA